MPFKSKKQSRKCHAVKAQNPSSTWDCSEWAAKTDYQQLPEKVAYLPVKPRLAVIEDGIRIRMNGFEMNEATLKRADRSYQLYDDGLAALDREADRRLDKVLTKVASALNKLDQFDRLLDKQAAGIPSMAQMGKVSAPAGSSSKSVNPLGTGMGAGSGGGAGVGSSVLGPKPSMGGAGRSLTQSGLGMSSASKSMGPLLGHRAIGSKPEFTMPTASKPQPLSSPGSRASVLTSSAPKPVSAGRGIAPTAPAGPGVSAVSPLAGRMAGTTPTAPAPARPAMTPAQGPMSRGMNPRPTALTRFSDSPRGVPSIKAKEPPVGPLPQGTSPLTGMRGGVQTPTFKAPGGTQTNAQVTTNALNQGIARQSRLNNRGYAGSGVGPAAPTPQATVTGNAMARGQARQMRMGNAPQAPGIGGPAMAPSPAPRSNLQMRQNAPIGLGKRSAAKLPSLLDRLDAQVAHSKRADLGSGGDASAANVSAYLGDPQVRALMMAALGVPLFAGGGLAMAAHGSKDDDEAFNRGALGAIPATLGAAGGGAAGAVAGLGLTHALSSQLPPEGSLAGNLTRGLGAGVPAIAGMALGGKYGARFPWMLMGQPGSA